ncbi:transcription elongation factor A N-terminal and central domain-containing protein 2-like [Portunus trituberculatus]|uniref:transcription elongation factor A N-terminal and central domain-containing protein 2-like n=1 Tax=Portunus trituberculatus TaxID=210409 RepID=UPI001E1CDDA6|nr:transcription elongation factor A N-terminal and central domain-containing protein 2-like [Portunus trituberculatus]
MKRRSRCQATLDSFVVRSPRVSPATSPSKKEPGMRQATLESLKGVVVVEEMKRARVVLERTDVSAELKVDTLQHLLRKTPAKEVLVRTKLGKTVHKLCRAEEAEVAAAAQQVYTAWKNHILSKVNRPYIEVKCDLKTQKLRSSAKQMLLEALQREMEGGGGKVEHENSGEVVILDMKKTKQNMHKHRHKDEGTSVGKSSGKRPRSDSTEEEPVIHNTKQRIEKKEEKSEDRANHKRSKEDKATKKSEHKQNLEEDGEEEKGNSEDRENHKRLKRDCHTEKYEQKHRKNQEEGRSRDRGEQREGRDTPDTQQESVDMIADHLEREVYQVHTRRVDNSYRRTIRSMIFALRHQGDVRKAVVQATLSVQDFVNQHRKN